MTQQMLREWWDRLFKVLMNLLIIYAHTTCTCINISGRENCCQNHLHAHFASTVEALWADTLVSGQLYLRPPRQNPVWTLTYTNSVFTHSCKWPAPCAVVGNFSASWGCPLTEASTIHVFKWCFHAFLADFMYRCEHGTVLKGFQFLWWFLWGLLAL